MPRYRFLALMLTLGVLTAHAHAAGRWEPPDGRFPISGWVNPAPEGVQTMADAGFTLLLHADARYLDPAQEAGMWAMLDASWLTREDQFDSLIRTAGAHPAVHGYCLRDEPNAADFPTLRTKSDWVNARAPQALCYVNLFPNYANERQLGTPTYQEHVDQYMATVQPRMLSFDHYPWLRAGQIPEGFWANLEVARAAAVKADVPMWAFCRTSVWEPYPDPTEAMLRFEVFANLVYGAQGICYFRYSGAGGVVNDDGTPTKHFPMVRRINRIVGAWGPTLLKLRSAGVYHAGPRPAASAGLGPDTIVRSATPDRQLVIGDFGHLNGDRYVMLMNPDWAQPRRWRVQFAPGVIALEEVSRQDGELYGPIHAADGLFDLSIMAGGARLFRVVTERP